MKGLASESKQQPANEKGTVECKATYGDEFVGLYSWHQWQSMCGITKQWQVTAQFDMKPLIGDAVKVKHLKHWIEHVMNGSLGGIDDSQMLLEDWDTMGRAMELLQVPSDIFNPVSLCQVMGQGLTKIWTNPQAMRKQISKIKNAVVKEGLTKLVNQMMKEFDENNNDIYDAFGVCNPNILPTMDNIVHIWRYLLNFHQDDKLLSFAPGSAQGCDRLTSLTKLMDIKDMPIMDCVSVKSRIIDNVADGVVRNGMSLHASVATFFAELLLKHGVAIATECNGDKCKIRSGTMMGLLMIWIHGMHQGGGHGHDGEVKKMIEISEILMTNKSLDNLQLSKLIMYWCDKNHGCAQSLECLVKLSNHVLTSLPRYHLLDQHFTFVSAMMKLEYKIHAKQSDTIADHVLQMKSGAMPYVQFEFMKHILKYHCKATFVRVPTRIAQLFRSTLGLTHWRFD